MSDKLNKRLEQATYVAIIILALVTTTVLAKRFLLSDRSNDRRDPRVAAGTNISLPGVAWADSDHTLLLAISATCHYCTESAPFYQRLAAEAEQKGTRVLAVLPQPEAAAQQYVEGLKVPVKVLSTSFNQLGVSGTPTLILVGRDGKVIKSWVGKLSEEEEADVASHLKG